MMQMGDIPILEGKVDVAKGSEEMNSLYRANVAQSITSLNKRKR